MPARLANNGFETGIVTRDGERLVAFYRDVLGFTELSAIPIPGFCHIHRLKCGATTLRLVVPEQAPVNDHAGGEFMASTGLRYLLMEIENVHETVEDVRAAGCGVPVPPRELRPGRIVCQVQDPDGNHIELVQDTTASR
jgi:predicted enzyme related to lactoylglutathione lyase